MPIDVSALRTKGVKVPVKFYDDEIPVVYDPIKVSSPTFREEFNRRQRQLQREMGKWIQDTAVEISETPIPEDVPHYEQLIEAGYTTIGDIPKVRERLQEAESDPNGKLPSVEEHLAEQMEIDVSEARRIVNEINRLNRFEQLDLTRQRWAMEAELAVMLIKDWDIHEGGEPIPVEAEAFNGHPLPPQLAREMIDAIWEDVNNMGNPKASNGTRPG